MSDHVAIYLDESGDLGFDENKPGASDYFTITLLVCEGRETDRKIKQAVARTLKNKLNRKRGKNTVSELKGNNKAVYEALFLCTVACRVLANLCNLCS